MTDSLSVKLLRMFVAEHDEGDGPEQVMVEVADLRHVLRLLDSVGGDASQSVVDAVGRELFERFGGPAALKSDWDAHARAILEVMAGAS